MSLQKRLAVNSFDKNELPLAIDNHLGLEVDEYLWPCTPDEMEEKRKHVTALMIEGFSTFSFHGTAVSRDVAAINKLPDEKLLSIYNESYRQAYFHHIDRIVFHTNYLSGIESQASWVGKKTIFWKEFLRDKPLALRVYLENFIDDTPDLLGQLCDAVSDPRLRICLDTGHARCNSSIGLMEWITELNTRIEHVHVHNNDGKTDKHWPLGKGVIPMKGILEGLLFHTNASMFVLECNLQESLLWLQQIGLTENI